MKKNVLKTILMLVFLILFNVIYFMAGGTAKTASAWVAYGFIHASYLLLVLSGVMSGRDGRTAELLMPVYSISLLYFVANLLAGSVIIVLAPERVKICVVLELLMLGVYVIFLCTTLFANEDTAGQAHESRMEKRYVQECSAHVKSMMDRTADRTVYKKLERVYDVLHASPLKSNDAAMEYELEVIRLLGVLDRNLTGGDEVAADQNIQDILRNAGARNRMLRAGQ